MNILKESVKKYEKVNEKISLYRKEFLKNLNKQSNEEVLVLEYNDKIVNNYKKNKINK